MSYPLPQCLPLLSFLLAQLPPLFHDALVLAQPFPVLFRFTIYPRLLRFPLTLLQLLYQLLALGVPSFVVLFAPELLIQALALVRVEQVLLCALQFVKFVSCRTYVSSRRQYE